MEKPKDHTIILVGSSSEESHTETVYYKDYTDFRHLPGVAQSEQTRLEFEAYKKWEGEQGPKIDERLGKA